MDHRNLLSIAFYIFLFFITFNCVYEIIKTDLRCVIKLKTNFKKKHHEEELVKCSANHHNKCVTEKDTNFFDFEERKSFSETLAYISLKKYIRRGTQTNDMSDENNNNCLVDNNNNNIEMINNYDSKGGRERSERSFITLLIISSVKKIKTIILKIFEREKKSNHMYSSKELQQKEARNLINRSKAILFSISLLIFPFLPQFPQQSL